MRSETCIVGAGIKLGVFSSAARPTGLYKDPSSSPIALGFPSLENFSHTPYVLSDLPPTPLSTKTLAQVNPHPSDLLICGLDHDHVTPNIPHRNQASQGRGDPPPGLLKPR